MASRKGQTGRIHKNIYFRDEQQKRSSRSETETKKKKNRTKIESEKQEGKSAREERRGKRESYKGETKTWGEVLRAFSFMHSVKGDTICKSEAGACVQVAGSEREGKREIERERRDHCPNREGVGQHESEW